MANAARNATASATQKGKARLMKWFKKEPKAVDVLMRMQMTGIEVKHTIEHKPHPAPIQGAILFTNEYGQEWHAPPFMISGKSSMPFYIPKSWITGKQSDGGHFKFELKLYY